uniref:Non-capsid protein NS-1 n=1 Tax=Talaromyces marneffei PM1 TaxID=1077442 RepID=A0A093UV63_TALMA
MICDRAEYEEEEKAESSQKTQDTLFQQQQVLYRDGLLTTMDKATKRRARSHQSSNNDESSDMGDNSNDGTALVRGSSKSKKAKKKKQKVQNEAPTFKDILELHKDSAKQERRLIKSLIKPSMGINQDVLREEIKKISARFDKMEGDINHKFDMILQRLEKGRRK